MNRFDFKINPLEGVYFWFALIFSAIVYLVLTVSIVGIFILAYVAIIFAFGHGLMIGMLRGNAVRIGENQFPDVHKLVLDLCDQMGIKNPPKVYVMESAGFLNAFTTRFFNTNYVVIYSEIFELAYQQGEEELKFVIAHELAHIKRNHLLSNWLFWPAEIIPFFAMAYSRAQEYTCDHFASLVAPKGAENGMLILAAGKDLYRKVNKVEFLKQPDYDSGFFVWFSEKLATHPHLTNRLRLLQSSLQGKPYEGFDLGLPILLMIVMCLIISAYTFFIINIILHPEQYADDNTQEEQYEDEQYEED